MSGSTDCFGQDLCDAVKTNGSCQGASHCHKAGVCDKLSGVFSQVVKVDTPPTRKGQRPGVIPESAGTSRASDPLLSTAPDPLLGAIRACAVTDPLLSRGPDPLLLSPTRRMSGASMGPRSDYGGAQAPAS